MARAPDKRIEQAKEMYLQGQRLVEIASQLNLPEGTVRRWKCTHKWENERSEKKSERSEKKKSKKKKAAESEVEQVIENPDLTDKQRLFCIYYLTAGDFGITGECSPFGICPYFMFSSSSLALSLTR